MLFLIFSNCALISQPPTVPPPERRPEQPREHPDRRRLSRAVRAEEAEDLPRAHLERDAIDRDEIAEAFREVLHDDGVLVHAHSRMRETNVSSTPGGISRLLRHDALAPHRFEEGADVAPARPSAST